MYGGRSSVGRAPDCGSGCRGFESHLPPHLKSGTANSHADLPFCNNGPSPSGKARDFDSRIPLVRIQLAQPAKRPQRINILWRSFGICNPLNNPLIFQSSKPFQKVHLHCLPILHLHPQAHDHKYRTYPYPQSAPPRA